MTTSPKTPRTELQAVNLILKAAGRKSISSLTVNVPLEATKAQEALDEAITDILTQGYTCLTSFGRTLYVDVNGEVWLPAGTFKVVTSGPDRYLRLVERGGRLYDLDKSSSIIGKNVVVDIVEAMAYDDLPNAARRYAAHMAAFNHVSNVAPGDEGLRKLNASMERSKTLMEQYDSEFSPGSMIDYNPHYSKRRR